MTIWNGGDIRRFEIVIFLHVRHDLIQGFVLGDEEIEDFALMFAPIQGSRAVLGHLVDPGSISKGREVQLREFEQCWVTRLLTWVDEVLEPKARF